MLLFLCLFFFCPPVSLLTRASVGYLSDNGAFERHLEQLKVTCITESCPEHYPILCNKGSVLFIDCSKYPPPLSQSGLTYIFDGVMLKNNEAMEALLERAIDKAIRECMSII